MSDGYYIKVYFEIDIRDYMPFAKRNDGVSQNSVFWY